MNESPARWLLPSWGASSVELDRIKLSEPEITAHSPHRPFPCLVPPSQLVMVTIALYFGLKFVRSFALQIAQENHEALLAQDEAADNKRQKKERAADAAAASAFAKVQPILTAPVSGGVPAEVAAV
jgi:hypothetical protein